ncbi:MAG: nucleoside recognition protein [Euryarchaeota archaeon]|nr:nucleoside recognition protein [Euryarchaeota archaeon]
MDLTDIMIRTVEYVLPLLLLIFVGLVGASVLIEAGLMQRLEFVVTPFVKASHLPSESAMAILTSVGSVETANAMVAEFRRENRINDTEMVFSALANSIPVYFKELFTYQIPIVLPALGAAVGAFYAAVFALTGFIKSAVVILFGRWILDKRDIQPGRRYPSLRISLDIIRRSFVKQKGIFFRISSMLVIMTFAIFVLTELGVFDRMSPYINPLTGYFGLPTSVVVPVTTYIVNPILGIISLGALIHNGELTQFQAMITLMLGSMFMLPVIAVKTQVPKYNAIFGVKFGLLIVGISTGISIFLRGLILVILLVVQ